MILSHQDIQQALAMKTLVIVGAKDKPLVVGPCNVELTLSGEIYQPRAGYSAATNLRTPLADTFTRYESVNGILTLAPGDFFLAVVEQYISISSKYLGRLEGKSGLARRGIIVHGTAGMFYPGWYGFPVLELKNLGSLTVELDIGEEVCSMSFEVLSTATERPYEGKHNNQRGI